MIAACSEAHEHADATRIPARPPVRVSEMLSTAVSDTICLEASIDTAFPAAFPPQCRSMMLCDVTMCNFRHATAVLVVANARTLRRNFCLRMLWAWPGQAAFGLPSLFTGTRKRSNPSIQILFNMCKS